jgi:trypsin
MSKLSLTTYSRGLSAVLLLIAVAGTSRAQDVTQTDLADRVQRRVARAMGRFVGPEDSVKLLMKPFIIGGVPASANENPFQVALLDKRVRDNARAQFCGGSLLRANVVVTAAHCSDIVTASGVQVLVGTRTLDGSGTRHDVTRIEIHQDWDSTTMDYDVALWHLATNAAGTTAIVEAQPVSPGMRALITGWGRTAEGGTGSRTLLRINVPIIGVDDCNDSNSYRGAITARMLCAGETGGMKDACQGDSGGPLTVDGRLVGITSWGRGCGRANLFGIYTKLSDPSISAFVWARP